ncbi:glycosyltransferase family 32 protein [Reticulomyxa filosa]|uniref:Glycosyltransferase family 32 protein n=1 Tax=Reticulomyxa filosa TaxID=46433 RepID=X6NRU4_RETFI|nr:glycosyltransferase family 32 protein [Reticulomyxa filosa]|eukprot:ETO28741.1 glycosyltransferase family 32 protein [Reticulomyxa filosa]
MRVQYLQAKNSSNAIRVVKFFFVFIALSLISWQLYAYFDSSDVGSTSSVRKPKPTLESLVAKFNETPSEHKKQQLFPRIIIQTSRGFERASRSWIALNSGWEYKFFDDTEMMNMVIKYLLHYEKKDSEMNSEAWVRAIVDNLLMVEKADLFRYIAIYEYGGIYADSDVVCKAPVDEWLPRYHSVLNYKNLSLDDIDFIVGVEFIERISPNPFQLVQWTFGAKRHSPIIKKIIDICITNIREGKYKNHVIQRTGPGAFTTVIVRFMYDHSTPTNSKQRMHLHYPTHIMYDMRKLDIGSQIIKLKGGINLWILPYRAFGIHPSSKNNMLPVSQQLVMHRFEGSWKHKTLFEHWF